jgi:hypothetical protein
LSAVVRYTLISFLVVGVGSAVLLALLEPAARSGVLLAAGIALPVQVLAFGLLARARDDVTRFFAWWGAGIALRVVVFAVTGIASAGIAPVARTSLVLSLAGFFFVLLLLEPLFLKGEHKGVKTTA